MTTSAGANGWVIENVFFLCNIRYYDDEILDWHKA
jgi:hypothetical protein